MMSVVVTLVHSSLFYFSLYHFGLSPSRMDAVKQTTKGCLASATVGAVHVALQLLFINSATYRGLWKYVFIVSTLALWIAFVVTGRNDMFTEPTRKHATAVLATPDPSYHAPPVIPSSLPSPNDL